MNQFGIYIERFCSFMVGPRGIQSLQIYLFVFILLVVLESSLSRSVDYNDQYNQMPCYTGKEGTYHIKSK